VSSPHGDGGILIDSEPSDDAYPGDNVSDAVAGRVRAAAAALEASVPALPRAHHGSGIQLLHVSAGRTEHRNNNSGAAADAAAASALEVRILPCVCD
jgi:hypothetical protein